MTRLRRLPPGGLEPDRRPARRLRVHPTPTGVVVTVGLVLVVLLRPAVSDPGLAGVVWATALGALVVGAVWPVAAVLVVRVEPAPTDRTRPLVVGDRATVPLELSGRLAETTVQWVDDRAVAVIDAGAAAVVAVPLTPARRGRFPALLVKVGCDAPFGLFSATRTSTITLPRPLVVGPAPEDATGIPLPRVPQLGGDVTSSAAALSGESVRSVRPYVAGDPAHLVHWPTTAHTGSLVVRELEPPAEHGIAVVLDLGPAVEDPAPAPAVAEGEVRVMPGTPLAPHEVGAELAVGRAAAIVRQVRADGGRVVLCTAAPGPIAGEVADDDLLTTRLAAATRGEPGAPPAGWAAVRVTAPDPSAPVAVPPVAVPPGGPSTRG